MVKGSIHHGAKGVVDIVFEFPYALVKSGYVGILLFALYWYITAPIGMVITLASYR